MPVKADEAPPQVSEAKEEAKGVPHAEEEAKGVPHANVSTLLSGCIYILYSMIAFV